MQQVSSSDWLGVNHVPAAEQNLPVQMAEPWFKVSDQSLQLEGLCFDRHGDLYFLEVFGGTIFKLVLPEMRLLEITSLPGENPAAIKIHRDGRLFVVCLGDFEKNGSVIAMGPNGENQEVIVGKEHGFVIDDMVFDQEGGFYFTDLKGTAPRPTGSVFYVSPDYQTITCVMDHLASPNGLALTPDQKALWVTEMSSNRLHFWKLAADRVTVPAFGGSIPYHFTGLSGPDSCCIDRAGNLYVAMYMQARMLVFNTMGYPVGQILLPGRHEGKMEHSTHPMVRPETSELIICANDGAGAGGSWLYKAEALAPAYRSFQFL